MSKAWAGTGFRLPLGTALLTLPASVLRMPNTDAMSILKLIFGGRRDRLEQNSSGFSVRVRKALRKAGWTKSRDVAEIEREYQAALGDRWLPVAAPFVRRFGRLSINNILWTVPIKATDLSSMGLFEKAQAVVGVKCCPLGASNFMGDSCLLWIDEHGRFYAIDNEGMVYVGDRVEEALEVLVFDTEPPPPPSQIKDALERAYEWDK